jgi:hypothetical protein
MNKRIKENSNRMDQDKDHHSYQDATFKDIPNEQRIFFDEEKTLHNY